MQYEEKELRFYKSTTWTKLSKSFRLRNPTCASCLKRGIIRQAVLVDHIEPIKTAYGWQHRLDESNLQSLCPGGSTTPDEIPREIDPRPQILERKNGRPLFFSMNTENHRT